MYERVVQVAVVAVEAVCEDVGGVDCRLSVVVEEARLVFGVVIERA